MGEPMIVIEEKLAEPWVPPSFRDVVDEFCLGQAELRARLARSTGVRHGNEVNGSGNNGGQDDEQE